VCALLACTSLDPSALHAQRTSSAGTTSSLHAPQAPPASRVEHPTWTAGANPEPSATPSTPPPPHAPGALPVTSATLAG
jgi:hypothetical protein